MIFNAILSFNHLVIYTQFNNLLFPRRSCSIGFPYPLESIHPVRKPNVVIFASFVPIMALYGHFTDFDCLRKSRRASFLRTISVKSGIEPVLLCQSNYTSTSWSTTSALLRVKETRQPWKSVRKYKFIKELLPYWKQSETNFKQN
jgi:hypothetical protein